MTSRNIFYVELLIGVILTLFMFSCSTSKKAVNIIKSHVDSAVVEISNNVHKSNIDSTTKKTESNDYYKITDNHYQPIEIDSDYFIVDTVPLIIKNKSGKQRIYLPASTVTEWGNVAKSDSTHVIKNQDSTVSKQKNTNLISDKKEVVKNKTKSGISFLKWGLFSLIGLIILFIIERKRILKLFI